MCALFPKVRKHFAISVGSVSYDITYLLAYIVTWNPPIAFHTDALSHSIDQYGVVGTRAAFAEQGVFIHERGVMPGAVKDSLTGPKRIERILVGQGVRGAAIGAASETDHGAARRIFQLCGEGSQTRLGEHVSHRQVAQSRSFGQGLVALQAEPCQSRTFVHAAFVQKFRLLGEDSTHIVGRIGVARQFGQCVGITYAHTHRSRFA